MWACNKLWESLSFASQELRKKVDEHTHTHISKKKHTHTIENRVKKENTSLIIERRAWLIHERGNGGEGGGGSHESLRALHLH